PGNPCPRRRALLPAPLMRLRAAVLLLLPAVAVGQENAPAPAPTGTWVPPEVKRSLERGERGALPCFLTVSPDLSAVESCGPESVAWGQGHASTEVPGATAIVFEGEPPRRILHRPGVPQEIVVEVGGEDGGQSVRRLYLLPPQLAAALSSRQVEARLFGGRLQAQGGGAIAFGPDGRYSWSGERGSYHVDAAAAPPGTVGVLVLDPESGAPRAYGVVEESGRIGLSPIAGPWPPPPPPPPRPWAQVGPGGAAVDLGALAPPGAAGSGGAIGAAGSGGALAPAPLPPPSV